MIRRLKFISIMLLALDAGVVGGGATASRADEFTRIGVGVGDLRGEILSLFAPVGAGLWKWRLKSNYPIFGGGAPTAGGLVFLGDFGGNFYALGAATGQKSGRQKIGGAIGGGVITYAANGAQKLTVAIGYVSPAAPVEIRRAKIAILGVESESGSQ